MSAPTNWRTRGKRLLRTARAGLKRVVRPSADEVFRPDYSDHALIAALARNPSDGAAVPVRDALREWKAGAHAQARRGVVEHFDRQTRLRFFFDTAEASTLAESVSQSSSGWRDRLERWTSSATVHALEVYDRPVAPLRPGFPWAGGGVDTRDDVLFAARPHRFAFAPALACATLVGILPADRFRELLLDWCRFAAGDRPRPAFISTLVVTQRLLACSWAYAMLGPAGNETSTVVELKWQLLKLIGQDIAYLEPRVGSSYPNNHLLVDRFASWYIGAVLPELCNGLGALGDAERLWLEECERQTYPDGGYFEPAVRYHGLATELLTAYVFLARRQGRIVPDWVLTRHEAMLRFQATLAGPDGQPPEIGDGTEDPMFPVVPDARSAEGLSTLYRMQWGGVAVTPAPSAGKEWALWMSGGRVEPAEAKRPPEGFGAFLDTGVFVFSEDDGRTRLVLRTAPAPESRVMPGHMHSDMMSIYLVGCATPLVVDSGTFTYRFGAGSGPAGAANWRAYFTGASAHNTVFIAGQDPLGPLSGDFRSSTNIPRATTFACRGSARLAAAAARLDAQPPYAGLMRGVVQVRGEYFLIWTALPEGAPPDGARFLLQLAPGTQLSSEGRGLKLERASVSMEIACSSELVREAISFGSENPVGGWVSSRYGEMLSAPRLVLRTKDENRLSAILFRRYGGNSVSSLTCAMTEEGAGMIRIEAANFSDLLVLNIRRADGIALPLDEGWFDGAVLWLRESTGGGLAIRSLATRMIRLAKRGVALTAAADPEDFDYSRQP